MANRINVVLGLDTTGFDRSLGRLEMKLNRLGSRLESVGTTLTQRLTAPILAGGVAAVAVAAKYETLQTSLSTLLGSAEKGAEAFKQLSQFAARTPFQLEDVAAGAKQLLAFGLNIDQVYDSLNFLGDIAGATGSNLQDLTLIFGQARSIGGAYTEDLRQLAERGVPVFDLLSEKTGLTGDALKKFIEQGNVTFPLLQSLLKSTAQEGGIFFGGMEAQSKTLAGVFSTFKDNVQLALAQIGNAIANAIDLRAVMNKLSEAIQRAADWFGRLNPNIQKAIVITALAVAAIGPLLFALGSIAKVAAVAITGLKGLVTIVRSVAAAFTLANAAILLKVIAVGLIIAAVAVLYDRFVGFRKVVNAVAGAAIELFKIFKEGAVAVIEGFAALKEGNFKQAASKFGEGLRKTNLAGIAFTEGGRIRESFDKGFADETNYAAQALDKFKGFVKGKAQEIGAAVGGEFGAGAAPFADPAGGAGGGGGKAAKDTGAIFTPQLETLKATNLATLEAFANVKNLQSAYLALDVATGEIDPDKLKFDGQAASAKLFADSIADVAARVKANLPPLVSVFGSLGKAIAESLGKALDYIEKNVLPGINALAGVLDQSFANRGAAIDAYYDKEKQRIEGSRLNEEQKAAAFAKLDEETEKRRRKLARDQAIRDKALGIVSAIINTAKAVTSALPNIPLAAIVGALGAVQVGLIAAQKIPALARGGLVTGETLAVVGDNPSGKEAIIPFERMGEFLNQFGGSNEVRVTGMFEARGQDLILVLDRARQAQTRVR